ncbi:MAG: hypothetical protein A4E55_00345 [Pelotomaculum sp. PtaU1.Bin035]|nr:MAG: hypothetical protein A4E53_00356 [Pelotomaculum sp. PtaB.Bin104]OPY59128.1 MAG: hypothetical protein A4E55_00345 [Pelotomaculum sp. PtaU1.Bin035]
MLNFTEAVKKIMSEKNITIAQVARETGYSWQYINDLLKNKRRWNEEIMGKVGKVVGLEIRYQPKATGTDGQ